MTGNKIEQNHKVIIQRSAFPIHLLIAFNSLSRIFNVFLRDAIHISYPYFALISLVVPGYFVSILDTTNDISYRL